MTTTPPLLNLQRQGHGPVLVLIHGVAGSHLVWDRVLPRLTPHFAVVTVDLLGYGHSPKPNTEYSPEAHTAAIRASLQHHGIQPPYALAGLSMGALLTLEYARRWPDEVTRLLGIGLPCYRSPEEAVSYLRHSLWAGLALRHRLLGPAVIKTVWGICRYNRWLIDVGWIAGRFKKTPPIYSVDLAQDSMRASFHAFHSSLVHCMVNNSTPGLLAATTATPQYYLHAHGDRWGDQAFLEQTLGGFRNCHLTILPGAKHNTVVTAPDATARWMLASLGAKP